jgi:hypothetical protein
MNLLKTHYPENRYMAAQKNIQLFFKNFLTSFFFRRILDGAMTGTRFLIANREMINCNFLKIEARMIIINENQNEY